MGGGASKLSVVRRLHSWWMRETQEISVESGTITDLDASCEICRDGTTASSCSKLKTDIEHIVI